MVFWHFFEYFLFPALTIFAVLLIFQFVGVESVDSTQKSENAPKSEEVVAVNKTDVLGCVF